MCVAIVKPANVDFPEELFEVAWRSNPHGGGFMYAKDGRVIVKKGFMTLNEMMESYNAESPNFGDSPVVLHFRIGTHGPIAPDQTHPHVINERLAFVHNGIISIQIPSTSTNSDTMEFNDRVLKHLPDGFTKDASTMELIRGYVDPSRLVFMEGDGSVTIVNEQSGSVDPQGRWHSNEGAMAAVDPKYQRYEYRSIIGARSDPDISKWTVLSKKARKALLRKEKKMGRARECKYCKIELRYHDEADVCQQCMAVCATCGEKMDPRFEKYGVEICEKCMTDEERREVTDLMAEESFGPDEEASYDDEVVGAMIDGIMEAESGWEQESRNLSSANYAVMMAAANKGVTEFTAWLRDNSSSKDYEKLHDAILKKGKVTDALYAGMTRLFRDQEDDDDGGFGEGGGGGFGRGGGSTGGRGLDAGRDPWESTEFNPPPSHNQAGPSPESGKILLIS